MSSATGREIVELENQADEITREVLLAVRKSFITPFDRGDIKDLIQSMDDAIDMMHKTVKMVTLFEQTSFEPLMQEMGAVIVEAAHLTAEAIPLLEKVGTNVTRLGALAEEITKVEERADGLARRRPQGTLPALRQDRRHGIADRQRDLRPARKGRRPLRGRRQRDQRHRDRERLSEWTRPSPFRFSSA